MQNEQMKNIEDLETYLNNNGFPIIRRCANCTFWNNTPEFDTKWTTHKIGYCHKIPLYFAFTLEPSVQPLTKAFSVCTEHQFFDEQKLNDVNEKVLTKDILKNKNEL